MTQEHFMELPATPTATAPDGSDVRVLLDLPHGGLAHFEFPAGQTSPVVRHRTVSELWYVVSGSGSMWLSGGPDSGRAVRPGVCIRIPVGTSFQVKADRGEPLRAVGATMPPWPGHGEAIVTLDGGPWSPTLAPGPH
jgi:mannose-6-phosphate isomerase-like protein (cupin superfamily)